jgi:hypothetical protein
MPDTRRTLNITRIPESDLFALAHAAVDAGTSRAELVRALLHEAAEKWRAKKQAGRATGYKFEYTVTGIGPDDSDADILQDLFISTAERLTPGVQAGGGYHQVDDNGNQTA